jgi:hypothetical protein
MTQSSAPPPKDEAARREPMLRIVASNENVVPGVNVGRPSWQVNGQRPHTVQIKQDAMLDRGLQARIGGMLREVFSDLADAPVPDRFVALLEALDAKEKSGE